MSNTTHPDERDEHEADVIVPKVERHPLTSGVELHILRWTPPSRVVRRDRSYVLTHGLASNARLWDGVARRLAAAGHLVVTVDQRGHGQSSKPDDGYDVVTCADDLADLIGVLRLDRPVVAGQSWGGNVVLELGFRHPELVDQIVCVDGGFIDLQGRFPEWDDCAETLAPPRLAGTAVESVRGWLESSAADWPEEGRTGTMANFEVRADGTIAPWLTFDRHLLVLRGLWEHRPTGRYPLMQVPVLLIAADTGDVAWTHSKQDAVDAALDALPSGAAHWFRPAHHDVHAQQPDAVASLLLAAADDPHFFD
ncbi:MAG: alpha/beta fold hydrolase [Ilumatobacter sp.]|jgi:pimeloyl-ACP methyl ester carboxylesterase|uniref:alpha/beta hydrolase n=1 Tax=Ilumatobacter sp. TaxID=1967498 RepID=UPI00391C7932